MLPLHGLGLVDVIAVLSNDRRSKIYGLKGKKEMMAGKQASKQTFCMIHWFHCIFVVTQRWRSNSPLSPPTDGNKCYSRVSHSNDGID